MRQWVMTIGLVSGLAGALLVAGAALAQSSGDDGASAAPADAGIEGFDGAPLQAGSDRLLSTADDRTRLAIDIPPQGPSAWVDQREIALLSGQNRIELRALPADLIPESLYWDADTRSGLTRLARVTSDTEDTAPRWQGRVFVEDGGSRPITLTYRVDGLTARTTYQLRLTRGETADTAELTRAIALHNGTTETLPAAEVTVTDRHGRETALGRVDALGAGDSLRVLPEAPATVSVTESLISQSRGDVPVNAPTTARVARHWAIEGADRPLTGLSVDVVEETREGLRPVGRDTFRATRGDSNATVAAGTSDAVRIERLQADYRDTGADGTEIAWRLSLENTADTSRTIRLEERIDGPWDTLEGEADWTRTATGLTRVIELEAGERREVGYRIRRL